MSKNVTWHFDKFYIHNLLGYNSVEDWHSAEITQKLHDFVIETDTETSRGPTDTGKKFQLFIYNHFFQL